MRIQSLFLCGSFGLLVACSPTTLSTSEPGATEGMVDTDGDGVPDSPDSDGDGIADEDDPDPGVPDDPEEEEEEEEEEETSEYEGTYEEGGIELLFEQRWGGDYDYCDESGSSLYVSAQGELSGEGWCYSYDWDATIDITYSGVVTDSGEIDGDITMLVWVISGGGGHGGGGWSQEEFDFELEGQFVSSKILLEWEGEVEVFRDDVEFEGSAWALE